MTDRQAASVRGLIILLAIGLNKAQRQLCRTNGCRWS